MLMSNAPKDDIDKMLWLINIQEAIRLIPNITGKARLALLLIPGYTLRNEDVHCSSDSAEELEKLGLIKLVDKQVGITSSGICTVLVMLERYTWRVSDIERDPFGYRQAVEDSYRQEDNDRSYAEYYIWCRVNLVKAARHALACLL